jgi:hypothetical protein
MQLHRCAPDHLKGEVQYFSRLGIEHAEQSNYRHALYDILCPALPLLPAVPLACAWRAPMISPQQQL